MKDLENELGEEVVRLSADEETVLLNSPFEEPFVPIGAENPDHDSHTQALLDTIAAYRAGESNEDLQGFVDFLETYPDSRWSPSVATSLGVTYQSLGYYSRALDMLELGWATAKPLEDHFGKVVADRALGELSRLSAKLGRHGRVRELVDANLERDISGPGTEGFRAAREGLGIMDYTPGRAYRCGPAAIAKILQVSDLWKEHAATVEAANSPVGGFSLAAVADLSRQVELDLIPAYRSPGAEILVPAVVHWRSDHYAALLSENSGGGYFRVADSTFWSDKTLSHRAIDDEGSGYFLVPRGPLPEGWRSVSETEALTVFGKGASNAGNTKEQACNSEKSSGGGESGGCGGTGCAQGMPVYDVHAMLVSLNIVDTPLWYQPAKGPEVRFTLRYSHRDAFQPAVFSYAHVGQKWTFDWMSYVIDNPGTFGPDDTLNVYLPGGGIETYHINNDTAASGDYYPHFRSHATLHKTSTSPIEYERRFPDGSIHVFGVSEGVSTRKIFLTEVIDPFGEKLTLNYDSAKRITSIVDAMGDSTTLTYGTGVNNRRIQSVQLPDGRTATLSFSGTQLSGITDMHGLETTFTYALGNFLTQMRSPYAYDENGTFVKATTFHEYVDNDYPINRYIEIENNLGEWERIEYLGGDKTVNGNEVAISPWDPGLDSLGLPPGTEGAPGTSSFESLRYRNTFYWDAKAMADAIAAGLTDPLDFVYKLESSAFYDYAYVRHWLHTGNSDLTGGVPEAEKYPDQNWTWFNHLYADGDPRDESLFFEPEFISEPTAIGMFLEGSGVLNPCELTLVERNALGKPTEIKVVNNCVKGASVSALAGRTTFLTYSSDDIDLVKVEQENGSGGRDVLMQLAYAGSGAPHRPGSVTDAAKETTNYTWNSAGQLLSVTNPKGEVVTHTYDASSRLTDISGAVVDGPIHFDYDATIKTRVVKVTTNYNEPDAHDVDITWDNLDRITRLTYPDATYEEFTYTHLDLTEYRDRLNKITEYEYDSERRLEKVINPELEETTFAWCGCGSLSSLTDALGNVTSWERDRRGRVTRKTYDDGEDVVYAYDPYSGRLSSNTDARGIVTSFEYDRDGMLNTVSYAGSGVAADTEHYEYDEDYPRLSRAWTGTTLLSASSRLDYEYYPYTALGQLGATQIKSVNGTFVDDKITYTYDELGRVKTRGIQDSGSGLETLTYDSKGRLGSVVNDLGTFTWAYNAATSRPATLTFPNGMELDLSYGGVNDDLQLSRLHYKDSSTATLADYEYTRRDDGRIDTWSNSQTGDDWEISYDDAGRLIEIEESSVAQYTYTYDGLGNKDEIIAGVGTFDGEYNDLNQLTTMKDGSGTPIETFTYDDNGNLTADGTNTYTWDAKDRLIEIDDGTNVTEIEYDAFDRWIRIKTTDTTGPTVISDQAFVWCGERLCQERDGSSTGTVDREIYAYGHQEGSTNRFYIKDHLGSVRGMVDDTGAITSAFDYDPYGRMTPLSGTETPSYGFAQLWHHGQTGLNLAVYRAYRADVGRWISRDPIGIRGGVNLFGYVTEDPLNWSDYSGNSKYDKLYGLPKQFWNWYHRKVKLPGDEDISIEDARDLFNEWQRRGKPKRDGKGERGSIFIEGTLLDFAIPWYLVPSEMGSDPCELEGGGPCGADYFPGEGGECSDSGGG